MSKFAPGIAGSSFKLLASQAGIARSLPGGELSVRSSKSGMININLLIDGLRELSGANFQRHAWLASAGPVVQSFSELVCQTFDDTGLADILDTDVPPPELGRQAFSILKSLDLAVSKVDQKAPPELLLDDPRIEEIRKLAAQALTLLGDDQRAS